MRNSDIYIFEDFSYNDEYLLNLSGIRGLFPKTENSDPFTYLISQISKDDHSLPTIIISKNNYFHKFVVRVNIKDKIIDNIVFISTGVEKKVHLRCLKHQVEFAIDNNYRKIFILAEKKLDFYKLNETTTIAAIGYKVFGKYGYMMYGTDESDIHESIKFIDLMKQTKQKPQYVHQIYNVDDNNEAKTLWDSKGWRWHGVFRLSKSTSSYEILKEQA